MLYLGKNFVNSEFYGNFAAFMNKLITKYGTIFLLMLLSVGIFMFWYVRFPHALSYQEQYQLFLWTGDYFLERISVPGGFADWLGEFIVQLVFGWQVGYQGHYCYGCLAIRMCCLVMCLQ